MKPARVYLMADFGKGPVSLDIAERYRPNNPTAWGKRSEFYDFWITPRQRAKVHSVSARAWWLVEAASADAARALCRANWMGTPNAERALPGRILASGGAR